MKLTDNGNNGMNINKKIEVSINKGYSTNMEIHIFLIFLTL